MTCDNSHTIFPLPAFIISIYFPIAMKELKRSEYNYIEAIVIGSRDQLCIHTELKNMPHADKSDKCKDLKKKNECEFYSNFMSDKKMSEVKKNIMDVEDLVRAGVKTKCCPYYFAKESAERASVIFMPYNVSGS